MGKALPATDKEALACTSAERALFKSRVNYTSSCWLYTQSISPKGYGCFFFQSKRIYAHRAALIWKTQLTPGFPNALACHKCRNKNCVRPKHLYWGTYQTNSDDARLAGMLKHKDRYPPHCMPSNKFTKEQIVFFWILYHCSHLSVVNISRSLGINMNLAYKILHRQAYEQFTANLKSPRAFRQHIHNPKGVACHSARLNEEKVKHILHLLADRQTVASIATMFDVDWNTIKKIKQNRSWKHVQRN